MIELALASQNIRSLKDLIALTPRGWFKLMALKEFNWSHVYRLMAWVDAQLVEYGLERTWAMYHAWPFLAHVHSDTGELVRPREPSPTLQKSLMNQIRLEDRATYKALLRGGKIIDDDFSW